MKRLIQWLFGTQQSYTTFPMSNLEWMEATYDEKLKYWLFINLNSKDPMERDEFVDTIVSETIHALSIPYLKTLDAYFGPLKLQEKLEQRVFIIYEDHRTVFAENKELFKGAN